MENDRNELHAETDAARAGSTPHIVRWVLLISLFAAIALLSIIWITGAATQDNDEKYVDVSDRYRASTERTAEDTDSIVGENADELEAAEPEAGSEAAAQPTVENEN